MIISISNFGTCNAFDYLNELCKHLAKRVQVEREGFSARMSLPIGTCDLTASETQIGIRIQSYPDHVDRMEEVFGGWLERVAFRENANLTWQRATEPFEE